MTIQIHNATDLFTFPTQAYAHGCNCQGKMGAGIARLFNQKFIGLIDAHNNYIKNLNESPLGNVHLFKSVNAEHQNSDFYIFNLFTQEFYGRNPDVKYASLDACFSAFKKMFTLAFFYNITSIAMPAVGAGLGGLKWEDVYAKLLEADQQTDWKGTLHVCLQ